LLRPQSDSPTGEFTYWSIPLYCSSYNYLLPITYLDSLNSLANVEDPETTAFRSDVKRIKIQRVENTITQWIVHTFKEESVREIEKSWGYKHKDRGVEEHTSSASTGNLPVTIILRRT